MRTDDQVFNTSEYWMEIIQKDLSLQVKKYMAVKELDQSQLAKELGVSKSLIAQVLKGKFNYSLSKLIDFALAIGVVPHLQFKPLQDNLLQQEKKGATRKINLSGNELMSVKAGKIKLPLQPNENGIAVSLDVHQVSTIKPSDTKIA
jgi:transcriptional regulator with XRE-family HTH domain